MTPTEIEPATFRLAKQYFDQLRHRVTPEFHLCLNYLDINIINLLINFK